MRLRWIALASLVMMASAGCISTLHGRMALPDRYAVVRPPLVFHSNFPLAAHHRLLDELTARRGDLGNQLGLPSSDEPVHVYLFDNAQEFDAFIHRQYPDFPQRRAFFVETDTQLMVYAQWGDRVAEDLRHEATHAFLHAAVPSLPLWLDEGLAEYFETPRGQLGMNTEHLELLSPRIEQGQWRPDLRRVERLTRALEMTQHDYAECWAWVHFMLHSRPENAEVLRAYLADLRRHGTAEPLSERLARVSAPPERAMVEHVQGLVRR
jgi:hypothetical protein